MSKKIAVIIGSTRPTRSGDKVADWFIRQVPHDSGLDFTLVDLNEINLPFLDESKPPMLGEYTKEHTKKWSKLIDGFDGFVIVTPEYNHGYPAVLKNAIDWLWSEWKNKPATIVSYSSGPIGGARGTEQLKLVLSYVGLRVTQNHLHIGSAKGEMPEVAKEYSAKALTGMIADMEALLPAGS